MNVFLLNFQPTNINTRTYKCVLHVEDLTEIRIVRIFRYIKSMRVQCVRCAALFYARIMLFTHSITKSVFQNC